MESKYRHMKYDVDIVFCIDATSAMGAILCKINKKISNFYRDLKDKMEEKNKTVNKLRVRMIVFRDYEYDGEEAMLMTDFLNLPEESEEFAELMWNIEVDGGGDDPEDGLEALAFAMESDWSNGENSKKRHIIVLWSDDATHELGFGKNSPYYPKGMPKDFEELSKMWGNKINPGVMNQQAKRLLMFTPEKDSYTQIRNNWDNVIHVIMEDNDIGLDSLDYDEILNVISSTI